MTLIKTGTSYSSIDVVASFEYKCSNCDYKKTSLDPLEEKQCPVCGSELILLSKNDDNGSGELSSSPSDEHLNG